MLSSPQGETGRRSEPGEPPALPSAQAHVPLYPSTWNAPANQTLQIQPAGERAGRAIKEAPRPGLAPHPSLGVTGRRWMGLRPGAAGEARTEGDMRPASG